MRGLALALTALAATTSSATSAATYVFSGTLADSGSSSSYTLLDGGSFSGSFTTSGNPFPVNGLVNPTDFTLTLKSAAGVPVLTITKGVAGGSAYFWSQYESSYGGLPLYFYDGANDYLQLIVSSTWNGTGATPVLTSSRTSYAYVAAGNYGYVQGGSVSVPGTVPEAPTWAALIGGFALIGIASRRRRAVSAAI